MPFADDGLAAPFRRGPFLPQSAHCGDLQRSTSSSRYPELRGRPSADAHSAAPRVHRPRLRAYGSWAEQGSRG
eukprot:8630197-Alexandrium_andersonii.AAC.1